MDEDFTIPITYKNEERNFTARLLNYGTSYKIEVEINGTKVLFEPDEERKWRAVIAYEEVAANKRMDRDLLGTIASTIEDMVS